MTDQTSLPQNWGISDARELYLIERWGLNYFDISSDGQVVAKPQHDLGAEVSIRKVVEAAEARGLRGPLLVRFQDILRDRVEAINLAFRGAIREFAYQGRYRGVFPIKVNQLREVVEEILDAGRPYDFGLEVGSKPELFAGLALLPDANSLLVCNGYKDTQFIQMALLGAKLGKSVVMVVEKFEELKQIIAVSKKMGVAPQIGVRIRLQCKGVGRWAGSGGEDAKFGLDTAELLSSTQLLKDEGLVDCFKLLHFHIGSQVPDIRTVKKAVQEASRVYAKLRKMGFPLQYLDVGGGMGVDYDGSRTVSDSSMNYTLQEYANDIVYSIGEICDSEQVPHPDIISESGRAIVAHHSVLVVEVFASISKRHALNSLKFGPDDDPLVQEIMDIRDQLGQLNKLEAFHDALQLKEDAHNRFNLGLLDLSAKAKVESLYWDIGSSVVQSFRGQKYVPEEILKLKDSLGDQSLCNFSLFQSLLDHWALKQLFPILPLDRLLEKPMRETTLVDITCDSDGQIKRFIDLEDVRDTLRLHDLDSSSSKNPYYVGFFLMGAYQDIMGDLHNLFGRVNEVHVFLDPDEIDGYYVEEFLQGNTIIETLGSVQYDGKELVRQMKSQIDKAIRKDWIKPTEGINWLKAYERGLTDYTYLNFDRENSSNA